MGRPTWSGSISFGLVNVPVQAHTAVRDHDIHFHQVEKGSGSRIRNRKVAERSGKEVDADDIELGFEVRAGKYVTFTKDELDDLRPESTKSIEVSDFVALADIDPIYYERTYWLAPAGDAARQAYQLLLAVMEDRQRVAIGRVVIRNKQYLAAIRPLDGVLAMSTMRFADEIVPRSDIDALPKRASRPDPKAIRLATQIVEGLAADWDPQRYHDDYVEELRARIAMKGTGRAPVDDEPRERSDDGKVLDLMAALAASVDATRGAGKGAAKRPAAKRGAPSRKRAKRSA